MSVVPTEGIAVLEAAPRDLRGAVGTLTTSAQDIRSKLEQIHQYLKSTKDALKVKTGEFETLSKTQEGLKSQLEELTTKQAEAQQKLEEADKAAKLKEEELSQLNQKLTEETVKVGELNKQIAAKQESLDLAVGQNSEEIQQRLKEIDGLNTDLVQLEGEFELLSKKVTELVGEAEQQGGRKKFKLIKRGSPKRSGSKSPARKLSLKKKASPKRK